jgi:type IV pilus assembly protein PilF
MTLLATLGSRTRPRKAVGVAPVLAVLLGGCVAVPVPDPSNPGRSLQQTSVPAAPDPARRAAVRLELASLYFARGQSETALEELRQALEARPDMAEAHSLRGLVYASLGDTARSEQSFRRALELNPRDADAMHNFGWTLCQRQRYDEADALFARALGQPQYRDQMRTMLARGVCQARAGRWAEAEASLTRSYQLDPTNPVTAYNLAEVLLQRGELERARFYVSRINGQPGLSSAQSLFLAVRIERRLGSTSAVQDFGRQLLERFPQSAEALRYQQGRFDD